MFYSAKNVLHIYNKNINAVLVLKKFTNYVFQNLSSTKTTKKIYDYFLLNIHGYPTKIRHATDDFVDVSLVLMENYIILFLNKLY